MGAALSCTRGDGGGGWKTEKAPQNRLFKQVSILLKVECKNLFLLKQVSILFKPVSILFCLNRFLFCLNIKQVEFFLPRLE